jgi:8-oxo-dGTP pyrophosphatase MutT (NUDIX family)
MITPGEGFLCSPVWPCVEEFTWEFPAGTVDVGETPEDAARRELREETAMETEELIYLGNCHPDIGRLEVSSRAFYGRVRPIAGSSPDRVFRSAASTPASLVSFILPFTQASLLAIYRSIETPDSVSLCD